MTQDVIYLPSPPKVVDKMLEVAGVGALDLVYDLGCGDGRILVTAALRFGARCVGVEVDPLLAGMARDNAERNGVGHLVTIEERSFFDVDFSQASVVMLFLFPPVIARLIPQLRRLSRGARVVSHNFEIQGIPHDGVWYLDSGDDISPEVVREHDVYLWRAPLRAGE